MGERERAVGRMRATGKRRIRNRHAREGVDRGRIISLPHARDGERLAGEREREGNREKKRGGRGRWRDIGGDAFLSTTEIFRREKSKRERKVEEERRKKENACDGKISVARMRGGNAETSSR